ncbi:MAG: TerC family protein [Actinomycetales bacterium]
MHVTPAAWVITLAVLAAVLAFDLFVIGRRPHEPSMREAAIAVTIYIALAVAFGLGVLAVSGGQYAGEFYAGWLTEYSLSIDNLFVFLLLMARFNVPRHLQQSALMIGIIMALIMRGIFIAVGAAAIERFSWVFYLFGAFLVWTAVKLVKEQRGGSEETTEDYEDNAFLRWVKRHVRATDDFHGPHLTVKQGGKRLVTPMFIVVAALGTTDLLFALDSIPAIYGLTREPYLVLTANVFALMGLRQLYFLLGGLLQRLVYLSYGLAIVLGFIGVKLILEALHLNELPFVNGGERIPWAPEIPTLVSLGVIVGVLAVTTVLSLRASRQTGAGEPAPVERSVQ